MASRSHPVSAGDAEPPAAEEMCWCTGQCDGDPSKCPHLAADEDEGITLCGNGVTRYAPAHWPRAEDGTTDGKPVEVGRFYWVQPEYDPDLELTPEELGDHPDDSDEAFNRRFHHWTNQMQPARFAGLSSDGAEMWWFLGIDGSGPHGAVEWPVRWVGTEIIS